MVFGVRVTVPLGSVRVGIRVIFRSAGGMPVRGLLGCTVIEL